MAAAMNGSPLLRATGLWLRTSARGGEYLVGRLGGLKVLVLANRDKVADDDPTHVLYFAEPAERPAEAARNATTRRNPDS